jgi:hypothetical protein
MGEKGDLMETTEAGDRIRRLILFMNANITGSWLEEPYTLAELLKEQYDFVKYILFCGEELSIEEIRAEMERRGITDEVYPKESKWTD